MLDLSQHKHLMSEKEHFWRFHNKMSLLMYVFKNTKNSTKNDSARAVTLKCGTVFEWNVRRWSQFCWLALWATSTCGVIRFSVVNEMNYIGVGGCFVISVPIQLLQNSGSVYIAILQTRYEVLFLQQYNTAQRVPAGVLSSRVYSCHTWCNGIYLCCYTWLCSQLKEAMLSVFGTGGVAHVLFGYVLLRLSAPVTYCSRRTLCLCILHNNGSGLWTWFLRHNWSLVHIALLWAALH